MPLMGLMQPTASFGGMSLLGITKFISIIDSYIKGGRPPALLAASLLLLFITWLVLGTHLLLTFLLGRYIDLHGLM